MEKELEALKYVNGKIADLEDDLQHYTMVDKDKCKEFYIREDLKQFNNILENLQELKVIKEAKPSEAMELVDKMTNYILLDEEYGFIDDEEKQVIIKDRDTIRQYILKAQEQNMKYNEINKTFSDSHICEIKKEFAKYTPLCEESKCDECPLAVGDGICLKNVFEKKWELQIKSQELEKKNAELNQHIKRWHDLLLKTGINSKGTVVDEIENYWTIKVEAKNER